MSHDAPMAPTYGLRAGAGLVLVSGAGGALVSPWPWVGILTVVASLGLVLPTLRRGAVGRGRVACIAGGWFVAAFLVALFALTVDPWAVALSVGLLGASMTSLIGCGVGWK